VNNRIVLNIGWAGYYVFRAKKTIPPRLFAEECHSGSSSFDIVPLYDKNAEVEAERSNEIRLYDLSVGQGLGHCDFDCELLQGQGVRC
jgi:hypothetical protein